MMDTECSKHEQAHNKTEMHDQQNVKISAVLLLAYYIPCIYSKILHESSTNIRAMQNLKLKL